MMSPITSALRFTPVYSASPAPQGLDARQAAAAASIPGAQVILGQDTRIPDSQTYSSRGTLGNAQPRYVWEQDSIDKLSMHMLGSIKGNSTAARFQGLGAALMEQLVANGGQRVSQSALQVAENTELAPTLLALQQSRLREHASNSITLNLTTATGATVKLGLYNGEQGLAVDADVQGGTLSAAEFKGLATLANGFQSAINGLTQETPSLQLGALLKLDPSLFTGLQMNASLETASGELQTFDLRMDDSTRNLKLQGPSGQIQLDLDTQGGVVLGNPQQRQAAVSNYLSQFDAAQARGKGDAQLMTLFKDAFSQLNSVDDSSPRPAGHEDAINRYSRSLLSGLADFNASISQTSQRLNSHRPDEEDRFSYQASQATTTNGGGITLDVKQHQDAKLDAAWHTTLSSSAKLDQGLDPNNYRYHMLSEQASASTHVGFVNGTLSEASATQEANSTHRVLTYQNGELKSDVSTPQSVRKSRDLMDMLNQLLKQDKEARRIGVQSNLDQQLAASSHQWLLQSDPSKIAD